ncbi:MAG TPA: relaxase/mobilization nuclease domain-containing protein, partial [Thermoanaerobaculia bacterium]|nr:relaxase/mobilization nuclease domain-containing protein [Thermoanaerobaculia bacterium]
MIGLVVKGAGVRGLMNYLQERREDSTILATDLLGSTPREFARQFRDVYALRDSPLASPTAHLILRPAEGEDLTDEQWAEALTFTLAQMGYGNSPHVAYLHDHGDGRHLHISTIRIAYDGTTVSDSNDQYRIMTVARGLEERFGLLRPMERQGGRLSKAEVRRRLADPERANRVAALREAIDRAAESSKTLREFCSRLERHGVHSRIKVARNTGVAQGITFTLYRDGTEEIFKGSEVGKKYSLAAIVNRHELLLNHRPTAPILAITELPRREVDHLRRDGLAPDSLARTGSRWTGYWH